MALSKLAANSFDLTDNYAFTGTTTGATSTQKIFLIKNIDASSDSNISFVNGSNYNVTKTSATFWSEQVESDGGQIQYRTGQDLAQSTDEQIIMNNLGNGNDESGAGIMMLYNPSSTTFVKHFVCRHQYYHFGNVGGSTAGYAIDNYTAGYLNTTSAVNNIRFKMSSGEIQGGTIDLFGVV